MEKFAKYSKIHLISKDTFYRYQRHFIQPAILKYWQSLQSEVFEELREKEIIIAGDGRMDSPGHSATYCTYTFADCNTKKIIAICNVDVREAEGKSSNMEIIGFRKAAAEIMRIGGQYGIKIVEIVSDAHPSVKAEMGKPNRTFKDAILSLDMWHGGKNLLKKIVEASHAKNCAVLSDWAPDIRNHLWYCARECNEDYDVLVASFQSCLNHVTNYHEWMTDFGAGFAFSHKIPLPEEERNKPWLDEDSAAYKALENIVFNNYFEQNLKYYVRFRHTGFLESFHNQILAYVSKRNAYTWPSYCTRILLSAIDYNKHVGRNQAKDSEGNPKYKLYYNKKSKSYSIGKVYESKKYDYIDALAECIFEEKSKFKGSIADPFVLDESDPRNIWKHISLLEIPAKETIVTNYISRFEKSVE